MAQRWLILGAGGHGRSVADAIAASGDHVVGHLDNALPVGTLVNGSPVLGVLSLAWDLKRFLLPPMGRTNFQTKQSAIFH